ncbi:Holliday junction endonuclease [Dehalobacter sp. DCM]|uniref:Holliday junction endonuclease n=1 Tax=Dehalobacter sp. DCM TaxID=2907827 RepID=UPI00308187ED|nr:Holliday junction endonuclease [Dehalobacter sp. DCM]
MSYYLGIDASLTSPGFCLADEQRPYIRSKNIKTKEKGPYRITEILNEIITGYIMTDEKPKKIIIEGLSFGSRGKGFLNLAELAGIIKYELFRYHYGPDYGLIIVPPASLKQFATGKGNVEKSAMILQAYKESGIEFECSDECDAFWLAQVGRASDGCWDGICHTKLREIVLKKIIGDQKE